MSIEAPTIYTSRLMLREICEEDTAFIVACRSDPNVYGFFSIPKPLSTSEHRCWLLNSYYKNKNRFDWIALQQGQPIGIFGIKKENNDSVEGEVSYLLVPQRQGNGYAQEAVLGILEFALHQWNCKTALATIHMDNHPSTFFIERLGFKRCGKKGVFFQYRKKL